MPCYHPATITFLPGNKISYVPKYIPLDPDETGSFHVPCGQCIGCRLDRSRQWADRMMLELDHSKTAVFALLSYDEEHVPRSKVNPKYLSLRKSDISKFVKDLRSYFSNKGAGPERSIRFYAGLEYGDETRRPHAHIILFGLSLEDCGADLLHPKFFNSFHEPIYETPVLDKVWKKGITGAGYVSWQTCAYTARYVTKKLTGRMSDVYAELGIEPEASLMSRRPGIGGFYAIDHPECLSEDEIFIDDRFGEKSRASVHVPKYIFKNLELTNPDLYSIIKSQRAEYAEDLMMSQLQNTDLDEDAYLQTLESNASARMNNLKRSDPLAY